MPLSKERDKERWHKRKKLQPNPYLRDHLRYCPDYDPLKPGNHWETCAYINPLLRLENGKLQPKYPIGYLYPDGRVRLEDMTVVQPKECHKIASSPDLWNNKHRTNTPNHTIRRKESEETR